MADVIIRRGAQVTHVSAKPGTPLSALLADAGASVAQPCGGRGVCGKCAVLLSGAVSAPNAHEIKAGVRLACQAVIEGDAEVILPQEQAMEHIETGKASILSDAALQPMDGRFGAAIDIGTTTLALRLFDLTDGRCLGVSTMLNPQTTVAADVIGRIDAAMKGRGAHLQQQITEALAALLAHACAQAAISADAVDALVITGNTTMLYLLTGRDPFPLSRSPFEADHLFGEEVTLLHRRACLPPCLHAFVGADTTCAVLASSMCQSNRTALLCDIGTNGEMALWRNGILYVTSTAAGPAFEGAGISCGCGSVRGAIDRVDIVNGQLHAHTIGNAPAVGLCGSGLISTVGSLLDLELLDETGMLEDDDAPLAPDVSLTQADIRAVQLAKAAIAAGIGCLLEQAGCALQDIDVLYLAGGFGSHLSIPHAVRIGLIPTELANKVQVIGNAALDGAATMLLNRSSLKDTDLIVRAARHVDLGGRSSFSERYVEEMFFPEPC